jgi:hypothetical protein
MEHKRGIATVFRGADALGKVQYHFDLGPEGRVSGWIMHVDFSPIHPIAGRVPREFLSSKTGIETDLHLSLGDGTAVAFLVIDTAEGTIANGHRYREGA